MNDINSTYQPFSDVYSGEDSWDRRMVSWYISHPEFPSRFQASVLVLAPCLLLWGMLPLQAQYFFSKPEGIQQWTWNSLQKIILSLLLALLSSLDLFPMTSDWNNYGESNPPSWEFLIALVKTATYLLSAGYLILDKRRATVLFSVLCLFWALMLLAGVAIFWRDLIHAINQGYEKNFLHLATQVTSLLFLILLLATSRFRKLSPDLDTADKSRCPEQFASFISRITFSWFSPMAYLGWKQPLQQHDLWTLPADNRTEHQIKKLEKYWSDEIEKMNKSIRATDVFTPDGPENPRKISEPSLFKALIKSYWFPLLMAGLLRCVSIIFLFINPVVLRLIIEFVEDKTQPAWKGYFYATLLLVVSGILTVLLNHHLQMCCCLGMHVRGSIVAMVYRKSLKMTSAAKRSSNIGEMINLMSVDAQRFIELPQIIHTLWSGPLQMGLSIFFLWQILGVSVLAGLVTLLILCPIYGWILDRVKFFQTQQIKEKDGRIKMMTEILNGIKVIKLYAWEESFQQHVTEIRERELINLKKSAYLGAIAHSLWLLSPFLVALATFTTYTLAFPDNVLNPQKAFLSLSLLYLLRQPLTLLPTAITAAGQAAIAIKRLTNFLRKEELDQNDVIVLPAQESQSICVTNGSFSWGKNEPVILKNIDINIKGGQFVAVVGQVGHGKSSLCSALLGLMNKLSGEVAIKGDVAYVSQQAWIQNLSLRDNILFGKEMRTARYQQTLDSCSLRADLELLPGGDLTEIGERGANLSGGQRQRVSLARAVYSDAEVYILDDPLSAVDVHVGKHIFNQVIGPNGVLKKKTRLLITNNFSYLPQTDLIIVLKNGTVSEVGTYQQLLQNQGVFSEILLNHITEDLAAPNEDKEKNSNFTETKNQIRQKIDFSESVEQISTASAPFSSMIQSSARDFNDDFRNVIKRRTGNTLFNESKSKSESKTDEEIRKAAVMQTKKGKLILAEKSEMGGVKWKFYLTLAKQMSFSAIIGTIVLYGLSYGIGVGANFWLSAWARDQGDPQLKRYRLGIYAALGGLQGIFSLMSSFALAYGHIRASQLSHAGMLQRIMRAPMAFFSSTPLGRIIDRFSEDLDMIDITIPTNLELWICFFFSVLWILIVISINTPPFIFILLPLGFFYYYMQRYFISTNCQLKRLQNVSRSPIYSHFQESVAGSSTILATKQSERFIKENENRIDINNASYYHNIVSQRWIALRVGIIGLLVTFFAALLAVLGREYPNLGINHEQIALSVSYALTLTHLLNMLVRWSGDLESNVISVERIKEYTEIETEADWEKDDKQLPSDWPTAGRIQFNNYKTKYRNDLDLVLTGVNAQISAGEKIGIVGRTGSGKSSLCLALFRIIEAVEGSIVIDGIHIANLGLRDLRSRISILPQEPVLFSGTLRQNLDPFGKFTDQEIWMALESSHLKNYVSSLSGELNHLVSDGGENYSAGQRQLICLARALLRKTKIIVLDEATAAVDLETDVVIQAAIKEKFADCTILNVAHRLNTIMDSDRVIVLDQGKVAEFGSPADLLKNSSGVFYSLAKAANLLPYASSSEPSEDFSI